MSDLDAVRKYIIRAFKLSGYQIRSELALFVAEQLIDCDTDECNRLIDRITSHVQNQGLSVPNIEKDHLILALKECNNVGLRESETVFSVINAMDVPRFKYNPQSKKFMPNNKRKCLLPKATGKSEYLDDRYAMLLQRTSRHELFAENVLGITSKSAKKYVLKKCENLLSSSRLDEVVILGILTQLTEGKFYIEDPTGVVQVDLFNVKFHSGLFCEGCFVLAEGKYRDGILKVSYCGFPPAEPANSSRAYFGLQNYWGGPSTTLLKNSQRLADIEKHDEDAMIVFLSDCWLDDATAFKKIESLFVGYNQCPPIAIVMMGPFTKNTKDLYLLKNLFGRLGDIISSCDRLKDDTHIVLVPAIDDPAAPCILPRPPLPDHLTSDLKKKCSRLVLASNPCRLQYCTQQIVVARVDLVTKLCRNAFLFTGADGLEEHFARTLICQGSLAPLHPIALPVYWDHDAVMSLYPLPDLVVIGDPSQGFQVTQHGCTVMNTGSFPKSKFSFKVYIPASRTVEDSTIPDD